MDRLSSLACLLFFLGLRGLCAGLAQENCSNYNIQFERVFSVPGDVAMLNSTLVTSSVFNFSAEPYNITWYDSVTGQEIRSQTGRVLVHGETLWFLNVTQDDVGEYVSILRTATWCYRQVTKLVVEPPIAGECGRPRKAGQDLTKGVNDILSCPLKDYISKLNNYNIISSIKWYKGCDLIVDGRGKYAYIDKTTLMISGVDTEDNGSYTCTLTFTLGGITGSVSETIDAWVREEYCLPPQVHEPAGEVIKAEMGSNFTKQCRVFVPCVGVEKPFVDVAWFAGNHLISGHQPSDRVYTKQRLWTQDAPSGVWLESQLLFTELREEDFNVSYTCQAISARGNPNQYFTLLPADPNIVLPIGLVFGGVTVLFIISVTIYYLFKVDIVLWFRSAFPVLYTSKDLDGKLYDAYVAYPQLCPSGCNEDVEAFAIHVLPQVLEKACGYKLFIAGRDCVPGQAIVDSVEENLQASRCLLLLYNASTFYNKGHTSTISNNNNISKTSDGSDKTESKPEDCSMSMSFDCQVSSNPRQQLEVVAAMHRALLESSLKVILVELEEISPAQLALFPESVRHLRKKQGAVCWWKTKKRRQRWQTCVRGREDEEKGEQETQLSPPISPSYRFWKEIRYHMPVRGKRASGAREQYTLTKLPC